jgi:hypothetical protein
MSDSTTASQIIKEVAESIDIPDSAYEKAELRYKSLADWFGREEALCYRFNPHIYPQGSFRLGTVVRPIDENGEYDLDMGCRLRVGVTKRTHSQLDLKSLVNADLEKYRQASGIKEKCEERHRCWRLKYADTLKFHLDVVPSIPDTIENRRWFHAMLVQSGLPSVLAETITNHTGAITDNRLWNYRTIDEHWRLSNSEGLALWFEERMNLAKPLVEQRVIRAKAAKIDKLPIYKWKSPLQYCVQLLKRHRDMMFADDPEEKPASIIITTLSGRAYKGEVEIAEALNTILSGMRGLVNTTIPRVPNPVNPAEDFADKWHSSVPQMSQLEANFWRWLRAAQTDFEALENERGPDRIVETVKAKLGSTLDGQTLRAKLGLSSSLLKAAAIPSGLSFPDKPVVPQKPAGFA